MSKTWTRLQYFSNQLRTRLPGAWIDNSSFLVLTSDRTSEVLTTVLISTSGDSKTIQTLNTSQSYGGWVKMSANLYYLRKGYVDKVVVDGFVHLAHCQSQIQTGYLTKSTGWEVTKDSPIVHSSDDNQIIAGYHSQLHGCASYGCGSWRRRPIHNKDASKMDLMKFLQLTATGY